MVSPRASEATFSSSGVWQRAKDFMGFGEKATTTTTEDPVDPENIPWGMYGGMYGDYGGFDGDNVDQDDKKSKELRRKTRE